MTDLLPGFTTASATAGPTAKRRGANRASARAKGKQGERAIASLLVGAMERVERKYDQALRLSNKVNRNYDQAAKGGTDIVNAPLLSVEVKRHEKIAVDAWWQQTLRQRVDGTIPVLFYRVNNGEWKCVTFVALNDLTGTTVRYVRATFAAEDFFAYYETVYERFLRAELGINATN